MTAALLLHRASGAPIPTAFRKAAFGTNDPFAAQREIAWAGPPPGVSWAGPVCGVSERACIAPASLCRPTDSSGSDA